MRLVKPGRKEMRLLKPGRLVCSLKRKRENRETRHIQRHEPSKCLNVTRQEGHAKQPSSNAKRFDPIITSMRSCDTHTWHCSWCLQVSWHQCKVHRRDCMNPHGHKMQRDVRLPCTQLAREDQQTANTSSAFVCCTSVVSLSVAYPICEKPIVEPSASKNEQWQTIARTH